MILIIIKQTGHDALSMDLVNELIKEVKYESRVHGPHWVITVEPNEFGDMEEGAGTGDQLMNMIREDGQYIIDGLYIKYPKGHFTFNADNLFTHDWGRITMETAIIKVVFPKDGTDVVWLLAPQHPFP
mgnify:FL=1